jgi:uncharacterized protein (DUF1800 family)
VDEGQFVEIASSHDEGEKTILGKTRSFDSAGLLDCLLEQPATAQRIARKLVRQFFGEKGAPTEAIKQLGDRFFAAKLDLAAGVATVLKSRLFFDDTNLRTRVLMPTEFVAGSARALELFDPAPSTLALADWSARMGQDLFNPPNVGGWPGGRQWINSRSLISRSNYAAALVSGPNSGRRLPYDAAALVKKYGFGTSPSDLLLFHHRLLFGTDPTAATRQRLQSTDTTRMVTALLSSPEAQLG